MLNFFTCLIADDPKTAKCYGVLSLHIFLLNFYKNICSFTQLLKNVVCVSAVICMTKEIIYR